VVTDQIVLLNLGSITEVPAGYKIDDNSIASHLKLTPTMWLFGAIPQIEPVQAGLAFLRGEDFAWVEDVVGVEKAL
jgi:hypothetical protein